MFLPESGLPASSPPPSASYFEEFPLYLHKVFALIGNWHLNLGTNALDRMDGWIFVRTVILDRPDNR